MDVGIFLGVPLGHVADVTQSSDVGACRDSCLADDLLVAVFILQGETLEDAVQRQGADSRVVVGGDPFNENLHDYDLLEWPSLDLSGLP